MYPKKLNITRRKPISLSISVPRPGAIDTSGLTPETTRTLSGVPPTPSTPNAPYSALSRRRVYNNIQRSETWEASIARAKPDVPDEIVPGLYLGNAKTAAAYFTGKLDGDKNYPAIARIVTINTEDYERYGIDDFPEPTGSGTHIQRLVISKHDSNESNLLQDFDVTGEFIHAGVLTYLKAKEKEVMSPLVKQIQTLTLTGLKSPRTPATPSGIPRWTGLTSPKTPTSASRVPRRVPSTIGTSLLSHPTTSAPSTPSVAGISKASRAARTPLAISTNAHETNSITSPTKPPASASTNLPGAVFVHCHAGVSRSATIVAAYLLKYRADLFKTPPPPPLPTNSTLSPPPPQQDPRSLASPKPTDATERAIRYVKARRDIVCPNFGFRSQLKVYYRLGCALTDPRTGRFKGEYLDWYDEIEDEGFGRGLVKGCGGGVFARKLEG